MRALQFSEFGPGSNLCLTELRDPKAEAVTAVVRAAAASITPSDVKNVQGKMEHTTLPRVPGRDNAGIVVSGPKEWIGVEVWGTGGEIGYSIDGSHADLIAVPIVSLRRKTRSLSMHQAAATGLTYLAAWLELIEYARLVSGETLLVIGANGGVGSAAAQIGKWRSARVIGVDRQKLQAVAPAAAAIDDFFVLGSHPFERIVRSATKDQGTDVVSDSVGGPMFEPGLKALAHRDRQLEIASAVDRRVSLDHIDFYHNDSQLFGVDTRARNAITSAALLEGLVPFFEQETFRPPPIDRVVALADGPRAYDEVDRGQVRGRIVFTP